LFKNYDLTVRPPETLPSGRIANLQATVACAAILIDYATNIFEVTNLRPEFRYWQERLLMGSATAPQLGAFLATLREAFRKIPADGSYEEPVYIQLRAPHQFKSDFTNHRLSKPAREASRFLFYYYLLKPKTRMLEEEMDRRIVAALVDSALGLERSLEAVPFIDNCIAGLKAGRLTAQEVKQHFRSIGVRLEYFPGYENREEESLLLV
jgi:hypothetical protein